MDSTMPRRCAPTVGFPRESGTERRTLLTPPLAEAFVDAGFTVVTEPSIGCGVYLTDDDYQQAGARLAAAEEVWSAPLVLRYKSPNPADLRRLRPGQHIGALFHAEGDVDLLTGLLAAKVTAWSYEFVAEDGGFPLGRPGGEIAGTQAVFAGAQALQHPDGRGTLLAGIRGVAPASVLVIGNGSVGAAAARTAAALGTEVTVLTRTEKSRQDYLPSATAGVRVLVNTRATLLACLRTADLVIGAVLISTYDTPPMIDESHLAVMRPGAVIVDVTCGYGPGYLPTAGPVQRPGDPPHAVRGILHVKIDTLPALVPVTASTAYSANAAPYLLRLAQVVLQGRHDDAVQAARIVSDGQLVHPVLRQHARFYGITP
ncbi:NAD(P)-dependent oxidoreductase [Micromonospora sp. WMMD1082]|uniref:NAD(P)-dependent oxidoreductase n=1 Tax=Micromonospora sp. WMMD1082 TaxID=3016104 RepID=UPI0024168717|nr:NAD(P)-dependent oxidoreductase [Micromonospora sp. WMMD1082]MDG4795142.1 NAD(P)-dependent oxidoreductase [Micromonospora sp. WMMD1082]